MEKEGEAKEGEAEEEAKEEEAVKTAPEEKSEVRPKLRVRSLKCEGAEEERETLGNCF